MKDFLEIIGSLLGLAVILFIAFGLVPLMVELAVANNWSGLGGANRWFYFFYLLTLGSLKIGGGD